VGYGVTVASLGVVTIDSVAVVMVMEEVVVGEVVVDVVVGGLVVREVIRVWVRVRWMVCVPFAAVEDFCGRRMNESVVISPGLTVAVGVAEGMVVVWIVVVLGGASSVVVLEISGESVLETGIRVGTISQGVVVAFSGPSVVVAIPSRDVVIEDGVSEVGSTIIVTVIPPGVLVLVGFSIEAGTSVVSQGESLCVGFSSTGATVVELSSHGVLIVSSGATSVVSKGESLCVSFSSTGAMVVELSSHGVLVVPSGATSVVSQGESLCVGFSSTGATVVELSSHGVLVVSSGAASVVSQEESLCTGFSSTGATVVELSSHGVLVISSGTTSVVAVAHGVLTITSPSSTVLVTLTTLVFVKGPFLPLCPLLKSVVYMSGDSFLSLPGLFMRGGFPAVSSLFLEFPPLSRELLESTCTSAPEGYSKRTMPSRNGAGTARAREVSMRRRKQIVVRRVSIFGATIQK